MVKTDCLNVFMCISLLKVFSTALPHKQKKHVQIKIIKTLKLELIKSKLLRYVSIVAFVHIIYSPFQNKSKFAR